MKKLLVVVATLVASFSFAADKKDTKPVEARKEAPKAAAKDIIDTAVAAGSFKTLATALTEAGLIDTLKGAGPFTVFAPTDDAFAKIAKKDLDALLKDKKKLTAVLTYHVVPGKVMAADVVKMKDGSKVKTVEGREFTLGVKDGKVTVDAANVTAIYVDGASVTEANAGDDAVIVLDHTPFYAESGGQAGDSGDLRNGSSRFVVEDTLKI